MKLFKKTLKFTGLILLLSFISLYVFDYEYILKGIRVVYFTGHTSAYIDDTKHFDTHTIKKGATQKWELHKNYNQTTPPEALLETHKNLETSAFLIIKNDSIFYENYAEGYSNDSQTNSFSMAKSIVTAMLFKAIADGFIKSIDTKVQSILPEVSGKYASELSVGDLSSMSSGLNWTESYSSPFSITAKTYYDTNIRDLTLGLKVIDKPGQEFKYLSGATQLLGMVIEKATNQSLSSYLSKNFWKPMGMNSDALWQIDSNKSGLEKAYCCIASNARNFARFGKLWNNNGSWNGKQLIPEQLTKLAKEPRFPESINYGYGLWLSNYKGKKISYMRGILGQYVISIPEDNIIIVRLGYKRTKTDPFKNAGNDFNTYIDATYEMLAQQTN